MIKNSSFILFFLSLTLFLKAQEHTTPFGLQFKPIFPNKFFSSAILEDVADSVNFQTELQSGFCFGMLIRHGFTNTISAETGINFTVRKYKQTITDGNFSGENDYNIRGYEIPLSVLVFIRTGEKSFMNVSLGQSLDIFSSDIYYSENYFDQLTHRINKLNVAVVANLGWEYRTENSGYFYFGATYHRPYSAIYTSHVKYYYRNKPEVFQNILGNYLTIDLRYFFHAEKDRKNLKKD